MVADWWDMCGVINGSEATSVLNKSYISLRTNATGLQLSLCKSPRDKEEEHVMNINLDRRLEGNSLNLS